MKTTTTWSQGEMSNKSYCLMKLIIWNWNWTELTVTATTFTSFQEWPRVTESWALLKNRFQGTYDSCFTILKISMRSSRFLLSSSDHNPSLVLNMLVLSAVTTQSGRLFHVLTGGTGCTFCRSSCCLLPPASQVVDRDTTCWIRRPAAK